MFRDSILIILPNGQWKMNLFGGTWKEENNSIILKGRANYVYQINITNNKLQCTQIYNGTKKIFPLTQR